MMTSTVVEAPAESEPLAGTHEPDEPAPPGPGSETESQPQPRPEPEPGLAESNPVGITEAAAIVGLTAHTLRYYEQQGLVLPARNSAGYREYSPDALRRLIFLSRMRVSGMPMRELRRYITLVEQGDATIPDRRAMMHAQRDRIRLQLRELGLSLETTEFKIHTYDGHPES